jgi:tRNA uridine 5-carboxymethylaminomethyl modification enzyme
MGVLVDDLVTQGTREPYRMFTSRAEYRLTLREDNADLRLMEMGHDLGLVTADEVGELRERRRQIQSELERVRTTVIKPTTEVNDYLKARGTRPLSTGAHLDQLLKRAQLDYSAVTSLAPPEAPLPPRAARQVEIEVKYEGYIQRQAGEIEKFKNLERIRIVEDMDYHAVHGLSTELKGKLESVRPITLGQAARIPGMTPAAISVLMVALKARSAQKTMDPLKAEDGER